MADQVDLRSKNGKGLRYDILSYIMATDYLPCLTAREHNDLDSPAGSRQPTWRPPPGVGGRGPDQMISGNKHPGLAPVALAPRTAAGPRRVDKRLQAGALG